MARVDHGRDGESWGDPRCWASCGADVRNDDSGRGREAAAGGADEIRGHAPQGMRFRTPSCPFSVLYLSSLSSIDRIRSLRTCPRLVVRDRPPFSTVSMRKPSSTFQVPDVVPPLGAFSLAWMVVASPSKVPSDL